MNKFITIIIKERMNVFLDLTISKSTKFITINFYIGLNRVVLREKRCY